MADAATIHWAGKSKKKYKYWIYEIGHPLKGSPGNYFFAKETKSGHWKPVYIGQTKSLSDRLDDHEKEDCAVRNGATHIHAHLTSGGEAVRREEESDLIDEWNPVCNG